VSRPGWVAAFIQKKISFRVLTRLIPTLGQKLAYFFDLHLSVQQLFNKFNHNQLSRFAREHLHGLLAGVKLKQD
jgi:hypothetical protein